MLNIMIITAQVTTTADKGDVVGSRLTLKFILEIGSTQ